MRPDDCSAAVPGARPLPPLGDGGPAFPGEKSMRFGQPNDCNEGMTLRDYFAAKALQGLTTHGPAADEIWKAGQDGYFAELVSRLAFAMADAMLAARESR